MAPSSSSPSARLPENDRELVLPLAAAVLKVIAGGRCSVASVLLALGHLPPEHNNEASTRAINNVRRTLGWNVSIVFHNQREWLDAVPADSRMQNARLGADRRAKNIVEEPSFLVFPALLAKGKATTWLDHLIFYVITRQYNVGIIIVVPAAGGMPLTAAMWEHSVSSTSCSCTGTSTTGTT